MDVAMTAKSANLAWDLGYLRHLVESLRSGHTGIAQVIQFWTYGINDLRSFAGISTKEGRIYLAVSPLVKQEPLVIPWVWLEPTGSDQLQAKTDLHRSDEIIGRLDGHLRQLRQLRITPPKPGQIIEAPGLWNDQVVQEWEALEKDFAQLGRESLSLKASIWVNCQSRKPSTIAKAPEFSGNGVIYSEGISPCDRPDTYFRFDRLTLMGQEEAPHRLRDLIGRAENLLKQAPPLIMPPPEPLGVPWCQRRGFQRSWWHTIFALAWTNQLPSVNVKRNYTYFVQPHEKYSFEVDRGTVEQQIQAFADQSGQTHFPPELIEWAKSEPDQYMSVMPNPAAVSASAIRLLLNLYRPAPADAGKSVTKPRRNPSSNKGRQTSYDHQLAGRLYHLFVENKTKGCNSYQKFIKRFKGEIPEDYRYLDRLKSLFDAYRKREERKRKPTDDQG